MKKIKQNNKYYTLYIRNIPIDVYSFLKYQASLKKITLNELIIEILTKYGKSI